MLLAQNMGIQRWGVVLIALVLLICGGTAMAQDTGEATFTMCTERAMEVGAEEGGVPGIKVLWRCENAAKALPSEYYDSFHVWHSDQPSQGKYESRWVAGADSLIFGGIALDRPHWFRVLAYKDNVLGYSTSGPDGADEWIEYKPPSGNGGEEPLFILYPGYWFLQFLVAASVLEPDSLTAWDEASKMGQWAFLFIAVFFVIGMGVWGYKTAWTLRSTYVFLIDRNPKKPKKHSECDAILKEDEFKKLNQGQRDIFDVLIKKQLTRSSFKGKLGWLNLSIWERTAKRRMASKELRTNPTARILISAAAAAYEPVGQDGEKEKVDPDRLEKALEMRIYAEEEELRKRSFMDILWALGVTGPLVGLFGTVTGISMSFDKITGLEGKELLEALGKGIHEALYTTICGLIVGIMFMLAYYWYSYKLERIHAIWVVFAATLVDRFKLGVGDGSSPASDEAQKGS